MVGIVIAGAAVISAGLIILALTVSSWLKNKRAGPKKIKGRKTALREAANRLKQNPRDPEGLAIMGDIYFREGSWDKAYKTYEMLCGQRAAPGLDECTCRIRCGISALKLGLLNDAYNAFASARMFDEKNFDINFNLGVLEFQRGNYDKAVMLLNAAKNINPEHAPTLRTLGYAFFRMRKPKEALTCIRKAITLAPDDKESLLTLAECYNEAGQTDRALRIFSRLREDSVVGGEACRAAGTIRMEMRSYDKALEDFELALRYENINAEKRAAIKYQAAQCCLKRNDISRALAHLRDLQQTNPAYKDVGLLVSKYQELNASKNLQVYLLGSSAEFAALCRKIVAAYFSKVKVKITGVIQNRSDWADVIAEVNSARWTETIMFRFVRTQGSVGELIIRDFHAHIKEVKAGKGICAATGVFTDEAKRYTEARLIDLIGKERLLALLNTVDAKAVTEAPQAR
ncbi:MAG: tetratricopeptide repeat protein [Treponema sp.]|jgi:tetratricopeptide (TPR) repeat protein|nr:tetratricopeptide repeat protein [Treponema sp.]